ncbi:PP2C family protein-serine/threonine phosphatase [Spirulina sp. 06S082]|uniref:PP2C family protein-serine/threonine phosphatase n=1 Tax=Spirulina sp. 06S082 TaxID=3110248 RepID=UPI002B1F60EF|nr:SpoIIE family protein phosphatase [Spirulina sp. 06S082]MEA5471965.1 SpoIIE family protein phosphatase [Spirulina sp. 06S082]
MFQQAKNFVQNRKKKGWSLRYKLTAAYSFLTLLIVGILTESLYFQLHQNQIKDLRDRLKDITALTALQINPNFHGLLITPQDAQTSYYRVLLQRLEEISNTNESIRRIYTFRHLPDGKFVFVLDYAPPPAPTATVGKEVNQLPPLLAQGNNTITKAIVEPELFRKPNGQFILYGYAPLINNFEEQEGIVIIEFDASAVINSKKRARRTSLIIFSVTLPIALLVGWLLTHSLTVPIRELVDSARAIAQGKLDRFVTVKSRDEIGILADAFNQMILQLQESFNTLEAKVLERTEQIEQAKEEISALNQRLKKENSRLSGELEITQVLQQMFLPKTEELENIPGLDIAGYMRPATEVGGDYYDIITYGDRVKICIGDVTGHGLESGVLAIVVQTAIRTLLANNETNLEKFWDVINRIVIDNVRRINSDKILTLLLLDYRDNSLYLSGQHEEVILVRADGKIKRIDTINLGFPVGLDEDITPFIDEAKIDLQSGDVIVIYTDGISEAEDSNGVQYGLDRFCQVIQLHREKSVEEIQNAILADLQDYIGTQKIYDDITLVTMKKE